MIYIKFSRKGGIVGHEVGGTLSFFHMAPLSAHFPQYLSRTRRERLGIVILLGSFPSKVNRV